MKDLKTKTNTTRLITILGPTASGKTALGVTLAKILDGEIISADSRQVYQGMTIGTGKDLDEYGATPYHLIDIVKAGYEYNLFEFADDFSKALTTIQHREKQALLVGGTGLYLDAVLNAYTLYRADFKSKRADALQSLSMLQLRNCLLALKPDQHNSTDLEAKERLIRAILIEETNQAQLNQIHWPTVNHCVIGLQYPREITRQRITQRLKHRLKAGMIEEVDTLLNQGVSPQQLQLYGLEYRFLTQHIQGQLSYNDMYQKLNSAIHQFAKQQEKWFRNIEKKGVKIHWLDVERDIKEQALSIIGYTN
jgi:tRNA dimethylallyltransferase